MKRPLLIFGMSNEEKASVCTISLLKLQKWGMAFQSLGVFEEQEAIPPKVVARLTDAADKTFSNLQENQEAIILHIADALRRGA